MQEELQSNSLLGDQHLDQKDAEEDEGGTAHVVFEHWQVQGAVLEAQEHKHTSGLLNGPNGPLACWAPSYLLLQILLWEPGSESDTLLRLGPLPERVGGQRRQNKGRMRRGGGERTSIEGGE